MTTAIAVQAPQLQVLANSLPVEALALGLQRLAGGMVKKPLYAAAANVLIMSDLDATGLTLRVGGLGVPMFQTIVPTPLVSCDVSVSVPLKLLLDILKRCDPGATVSIASDGEKAHFDIQLPNSIFHLELDSLSPDHHPAFVLSEEIEVELEVDFAAFELALKNLKKCLVDDETVRHYGIEYAFVQGEASLRLQTTNKQASSQVRVVIPCKVIKGGNSCTGVIRGAIFSAMTQQRTAKEEEEESAEAKSVSTVRIGLGKDLCSLAFNNVQILDGVVQREPAAIRQLPDEWGAAINRKLLIKELKRVHAAQAGAKNALVWLASSPKKQMLEVFCEETAISYWVPCQVERSQFAKLYTASVIQSLTALTQREVLLFLNQELRTARILPLGEGDIEHIHGGALAETCDVPLVREGEALLVVKFVEGLFAPAKPIPFVVTEDGLVVEQDSRAEGFAEAELLLCSLPVRRVEYGHYRLEVVEEIASAGYLKAVDLPKKRARKSRKTTAS